METLIRKLAEKYSLPYEKVKKIVNRVLFSIKPKSKVLEVQDGEAMTEIIVKRTGIGPLKTEYGIFNLFVFSLDDAWGEYFALVKADRLDEKGMPVFKDTRSLILRIDSGCETGQRFHDKTCECSEQLFAAMALIQDKGEGIIINIPSQDGRGKGLPFKLGTLELIMELELDTIEAASVMVQLDDKDLDADGVKDDDIDSRTYTGCLAIMKFFEIPTTTKINVATNNPKKIKIFKDNGYETENVSVIIQPTEETKKHLLAKQNRMGHFLYL